MVPKIVVSGVARVIVSIKIYPSDATVDLNLLKKRIERELPEYASVYKFAEEPIAFGLVALIVHIIIPEERSGSLDEIEGCLRGIREVGEMETLMVRRI